MRRCARRLRELVRGHGAAAWAVSWLASPVRRSATRIAATSFARWLPGPPGLGSGGAARLMPAALPGLCSPLRFEPVICCHPIIQQIRGAGGHEMRARMKSSLARQVPTLATASVASGAEDPARLLGGAGPRPARRLASCSLAGMTGRWLQRVGRGGQLDVEDPAAHPLCGHQPKAMRLTRVVACARNPGPVRRTESTCSVTALVTSRTVSSPASIHLPQSWRRDPAL
jgi:hypothetical protein